MKKKKFKIEFGLKLLPIDEHFSVNGDSFYASRPLKIMRWEKMRESIMNGKVGDRVRCPSAIWKHFDDYLVELTGSDDKPEKYVRVREINYDNYKITGVYKAEEIGLGENEYEDIHTYAGIKGKKLL